MKGKKSGIFLLAALLIVLYGCSGAKNNFGPLGSTHIHADFKAYVLGSPIDFSIQKYQLKDKLIHVENGDGDVMHIHATGIDLGYFFKTLGMEIDNNCITLDSGNKYCNAENAKFRAFVKSENADWEQIYYPTDYIMQDLDKILVTYGVEDEEGIRKQMESVTDKARAT